MKTTDENIKMIVKALLAELTVKADEICEKNKNTDPIIQMGAVIGTPENVRMKAMNGFKLFDELTEYDDREVVKFIEDCHSYAKELYKENEGDE